jgi:NAD(P)-dependent dehydrogenase (short-subunit alcohol dehydrogenase family)
VGEPGSTGKIAIVTGASSGIGRETSLALASAGFTVVLTGRRAALIEAVAREIEAAGGAADPVTCDVRDEESVSRLFTTTEQRHGRLDLLFNNAGVFTPSTPIEDLGLDRWREAVDTNLTGAFLCTRAAFALMKRQDPQGGRIINNGSISAHAPRVNSAAYTATKHAITGLTKSASLDGRKYRIACGQIDIGNAETELITGQNATFTQPSGERRVEPTMSVSEAARAVVYMASLPLEANVQFMTVMATAMPYIGRG